MRTLRIDSLNFHIYHIAVLIIFIMLYITSLIFIYLIPRSLYLLTAFIRFHLPPPPAFGSQKSDLSFYVCLFVFEV